LEQYRFDMLAVLKLWPDTGDSTYLRFRAIMAARGRRDLE